MVSDPDEGLGSNNWVIGGKLSDSGLPILASDPHIAFGSVSCWYQVHLAGAGFNVVGAGYAGVPGIIFGRNERVAWGLTNNICAQRDLYQEKEHPDRPGRFLYDGEWEASRQIVEEIGVRGGSTVTKTITLTRNGPLADEIVPDIAKDSGPVSLRWMGPRAVRRDNLDAGGQQVGQRCRAPRGAEDLDRADLELRLRRRGRTLRLPVRWSDPNQGELGPRLPAWLGPSAPVARGHTIRRDAPHGGPRPGLGAFRQQPPSSRRLPIPPYPACGAAATGPDASAR